MNKVSNCCGALPIGETYDDENPNEYTINVYGLEQHSTSEYPSTDTSNEIDLFELKL